jgi:hypothetical protein
VVVSLVAFIINRLLIVSENYFDTAKRIERQEKATALKPVEV